jgi:hypothetical protein
LNRADGGVSVISQEGCLISARSVPRTFWKVALTSTLPSAAAVSNPLLETVASAGFDDCQLAVLVTSLLPVAPVETANNCRVSPGARIEAALPATPSCTCVTVGVGVAGVFAPPQDMTATIADTKHVL